MNRIVNALVLLVIAGGLLTGCDITDRNSDHNSGTHLISGHELFRSGEMDYFIDLLDTFTESSINGYIVTFKGTEQSEIENEAFTTFNYRVSGTGETPQLDSFFLEIPECAGEPVSWSFTQSAKIEDSGIRWNRSVSKDGYENFSITFDGDIPTGVIETEVVRAGRSVTGDIQGPCKGIYTLSGIVFMDAGSGSTDAGISNVKVEISEKDSDSAFGSVQTTSTGAYSFTVLAGSYSISVPSELFDGSYQLITQSPYSVADLSSDITGINFGYAINSDKVISELNEGIVMINTEPVRFWVQQVRHAGKNNKNSDYSAAEMSKLLKNIENYFSPGPFQFGDDDELIIQNALDILTRPIRTELDEFLQQLLTAALNIKSGRGAFFIDEDNTIVQDTDYNLTLLSFGKALALSCEVLGDCPEASIQLMANSITTQSTTSLSDGTTVLSAFNGTGGIGSTR
jgi:hypothetical protein